MIRSASRTGVTSTGARAGPCEEAGKFLARYSFDTLDRLEHSSASGDRKRDANVIHGDARAVRSRRAVRRHRHVAALSGPNRLPRAAPLRLRAARSRRPPRPELGAAARGTSRGAIEEYVAGIAEILRRCAEALAPGAPVIVVVNDWRDFYPEILARSGLRLVDRLERHINRRTGGAPASTSSRS